MSGLRVLVCGGRSYADWATVKSILDAVRAQHGIAVLIQGEAPGADTLARRWAEMEGIPCIGVRANWGKYPRAAGPIRNGWMIEHCKPIDLVVAFPGFRGTNDMTERARAENIELLVVKPKRTINKKVGEALTMRKAKKQFRLTLKKPFQ